MILLSTSEARAGLHFMGEGALVLSKVGGSRGISTDDGWIVVVKEMGVRRR